MEHFDRLETRDPASRERALMAALPGLIRHAQVNAPGFAELLRDVDAAAITSRDALAQLPLVRKGELKDRQRAALPFAGLAAVRTASLARIYASPGPTYDPEGRAPDYWRFARALFAAGFRSGDLVHNCFAYHMTPAGFIADLGAQALGCTVFPGGTGNTEMQVAAIRDLRPQGYVGTPSFLRIIVEKADEMGADISSLQRALVAAEALPPALRAQLDARGIRTLQCYASADLGLMAYESQAREGMIVDEGLIVEIVRPGSGEPVGAGEVGEVVVTSFTEQYPLIRFATGDLSAVLPGASPCGRTNMRIRGWLGRADQATKVRGMFVHPSQVAEVVRRHPEIVKSRLVVDFDSHGADRMTLECEVPAGSGEALPNAIAESLRQVCQLRGEVRCATAGSLPNDGKVIEDRRQYST
ncbi:MAG: phenylacetate--CoA ligase family protein [Burkholderiales bacterium]